MRRLNCFEVERDLWRYVDRELPASGVAAVSEHLKGCGACRKLHHDRAREANVCRSVLAISALGSESSERIVKAMEREGLFPQAPWGVGEAPRRGSSGRGSSGRGSSRHGSSRHGSSMRFVRLRGRLALAAVCLIAATVGLGWLFWGNAPTLLGEFEADGIVYRSSEPRAALDLFSSGRCLSGNSFFVPEKVELTVRLAAPAGRVGASLTVTGPAELTLDATSTPRNFSALLASGLLKAEVRPRQVTEEPFVIRTPEAVVSVVGTEFVVDATVEGVTRLEVSHGAVDFRALDAPVGRSGLRVTAETGARVIRRGARRPGLPAPSPAPATASRSPGAGVSTDGGNADVGGATGVEVDPPAPEEPVRPGETRGTGSAGGPALGPSDAIDLDQVVNPHR